MSIMAQTKLEDVYSVVHKIFKLRHLKFTGVWMNRSTIGVKVFVLPSQNAPLVCNSTFFINAISLNKVCDAVCGGM